MTTDAATTRRNFLTSLGASAAWAALPRGASSAVAEPKRRPNIVFLITDDQKLDHFGFLRGKALTPNIDRLAEEGVYFSRAYASTGVCTPSRFTCLTGQYASRAKSGNFLKNGISEEGQTDVQWNTDLRPEDMTLPKALQRAGYTTGMVGKWHNGGGTSWGKVNRELSRDADPTDPKVAAMLREAQAALHEQVKQCGFDYAASVNLGNFGAHPCRALRQHNQEWITKGALDFLEQNRDRPFFLYLATSLMHGPSPLKSLKADPRITHCGLLDKPLEVQPSRESVLERTRKAGVPDDLAPATWLDDGIGAVLKKLRDLGLDQDTLLFYFDDHGVEGAKGSNYEGGVRTPLLVRWKGALAPRTTAALVQNIDFAPTILDACGVAPPADMHLDGVSLMPLLRGETKQVHDSLYFEIGHTRAVCTKKWKYLAFRIPPSREMTHQERVRVSEEYARRKLAREDRKFTLKPDAPLSHLGFPGGQGTERSNAVKKHAQTYFDPDQLYDLENDPDEQVNLANDPKHADTLAEMKALLKAHLDRVPGTFGEFRTG